MFPDYLYDFFFNLGFLNLYVCQKMGNPSLDDEWTQKHHRQLGQYVGQRLQNAEPLEFFRCCNKDETLPVEKHT